MNVEGVQIIELRRHVDSRGSFTRLFDASALDFQPLQTALSTNLQAGTLRGMHLQRTPHAEAKLVSCVRGRMFDVVVDLRPASATYCQWFGIELIADDDQLLYVPQGVAHGFLTLESNTEVLYHISAEHAPHCEWGVRWDDPAFRIEWPATPAVISERDRHHPLYEPDPCASC